MAVDPHVVAGIDLCPFLTAWVTRLEAGAGHMRVFLDQVHNGPVADRYSYGGLYLMANIGPQATKATAAPEELLLYAVLSIYQHANWPGSDEWEGERQHLRRAFAYFHALGEREVARQLRSNVISRSLELDDPLFESLFDSTLHNDLGYRASHYQEMAEIDSRDLRAAALLDPDGNFDEELTSLRI